ncbi:bactofilin family protein [Cohnella luojiensis]|uniref:Polymer-forming cytoskeletal protein n=1 Tax=Cohnella luojiensis TaxID=652876 RepID=A0A4Y8LXK6_9BACL|nr:polymer-forming cytoskeletal protein [Cohnella luojiensis]TFE25817.1 polymer-forming cytoskeletal protein [Cohnella luojiensis]
MFKKKKSKIDPNMTDTLIGEGTSFEGKIKSEGGIRVEGEMVGDIECAGDITIGEHGVSRSNIKARNVIVAGKVIGNVAASGKLTIKATGKLHGNLSALELSIESGGLFQGSSRMDMKDAPFVAEEKTPPREPEAIVPQAPEGDAVSVLKTW